MVEVTVHGDADLTEPILVEGLPGVGLVSEIATDHLVDELGRDEYATVAGDHTPAVSVFEPGDAGCARPVIRRRRGGPPGAPQRGAAAVGRDADGRRAADRLARRGGRDPIYQTGFPSSRDTDEPPSVVVVATGGADRLPQAADGDLPENGGVISGPVGALLQRAAREGLDAVGLVAETEPRSPDPRAARQLLVDAAGPMAVVHVDTRRLFEQAEEMIERREELAQRMQQAEDGSSRAVHDGMRQSRLREGRIRPFVGGPWRKI